MGSKHAFSESKDSFNSFPTQDARIRHSTWRSGSRRRLRPQAELGWDDTSFTSYYFIFVMLFGSDLIVLILYTIDYRITERNQQTTSYIVLYAVLLLSIAKQ